MRGLFQLGLVITMCLCLQARADSWLSPRTAVYTSEDGHWRMTVVPRGIAGPVRPTGQMEHLVEGRWQTVWKSTLVNETAPVNAIVSPQGRAVTFDNWHSAGFGDDTVVLYDTQGQKVRALALEDFLPREYVCALPRSVSSIWWGGQHGFSADGGRLILRVIVPMKAEVLPDVRRPEHVEISLDAATGQVSAPESPAWNRALLAMRAVNAGEAENLTQLCLQALEVPSGSAKER